MRSHRFFGHANFLFGLEPVIDFGARLIAAQDVEFVGSSPDSFFERTGRDLRFFCRCWCRHRCTSSDDGITDRVRLEGGRRLHQDSVFKSHSLGADADRALRRLLQVLLPPARFLIVTMNHVPRRPASVVVAGVPDELCIDVLLFQRSIHLLAFLNRDSHVGFAVNE